jgi:hypothetical protein
LEVIPGDLSTLGGGGCVPVEHTIKQRAGAFKPRQATYHPEEPEALTGRPDERANLSITSPPLRLIGTQRQIIRNIYNAHYERS